MVRRSKQSLVCLAALPLGLGILARSGNLDEAATSDVVQVVFPIQTAPTPCSIRGGKNPAAHATTASGTASFIWSLFSDSPAGDLSLDSATGHITHIRTSPTAPASSAFPVRAQDPIGIAASAAVQFADPLPTGHTSADSKGVEEKEVRTAPLLDNAAGRFFAFTFPMINLAETHARRHPSTHRLPTNLTRS